MIVCGFPGIGKTTIAKRSERYIDLDSSSMWIPAHGEWDKSRWSNWPYVYVNVAESLSDQGYVVFVSSHMDVQNRLAELDRDDVVLCYPDIKLEKEWIERLRQRCLDEPLDKNKRAYEHAKSQFKDDVSAMNMSPLKKIKITDIDYNLEELILA